MSKLFEKKLNSAINPFEGEKSSESCWMKELSPALADAAGLNLLKEMRRLSPTIPEGFPVFEDLQTAKPRGSDRILKSDDPLQSTAENLPGTRLRGFDSTLTSADLLQPAVENLKEANQKFSRIPREAERSKGPIHSEIARVQGSGLLSELLPSSSLESIFGGDPFRGLLEAKQGLSGLLSELPKLFNSSAAIPSNPLTPIESILAGADLNNPLGGIETMPGNSKNPLFSGLESIGGGSSVSNPLGGLLGSIAGSNNDKNGILGSLEGLTGGAGSSSPGSLQGFLGEGGEFCSFFAEISPIVEEAAPFALLL